MGWGGQAQHPSLALAMGCKAALSASACSCLAVLSAAAGRGCARAAAAGGSGGDGRGSTAKLGTAQGLSLCSGEARGRHGVKDSNATLQGLLHKSPATGVLG